MNRRPIFVSQVMKKICDEVIKIAPFPTTVLIEGETGVGKKIIAELIHQNSLRANMPFVKINCGGVPESIFEAELFGGERGSFSGGVRENSAGLFESAHRGTLFLDEIGQLSKTNQMKLLRLLQEQEGRVASGSWSMPIDVRIIASSNTDLLEQVRKGHFRMDLYYYLNVFNIKIPPLRERTEDINPLIEYFLDYFSEEYGRIKKFDKHSLSIISNYKFYGNILELKNIIESSYISSGGDVIEVDFIPQYIRNFTSPFLKDQMLNGSDKNQTLPVLLDSVEREAIIKAVSSEGSIRKAAALLGISNATMLRRIKYHGLKFNK